MGSKPRRTAAPAVRLVPFDERHRGGFRALICDRDAMRFVGEQQTVEWADTLFERVLAVTRGGRDPRVAHAFAIELGAAGESAFAGHCVLFHPPDDVLALAGHPEAPVFELGYYLLPVHWGRGIASTVASRMVRIASELGGKSLVATVDDDNRGSWKVCENAGFDRVATERDDDGMFYVYARRAPAPKAVPVAPLLRS